MRLWNVSIEITGIVMAETRGEAAQYIQDIVDDQALFIGEEEKADICPYTHCSTNRDTDRHVYHEGDEDITVQQAEKMIDLDLEQDDKGETK